MAATHEERLALIRAARAGDVDAFARVIEAHTASALKAATWRLKDRQCAEVAVQEACIEAYYHLAQLREPAAFTAWFERILRKQIDRALRGRHAIVIPLDDVVKLAADDPDAALVVERAERRALARAALGRLTPATRDVAELFYLDDLSHKQIAGTLDVPVTTVKKRLNDARRQLRAHVELLEGQPLDQEFGGASASLLTRVRFFIALQRGEALQVRAWLRRFPALAHAREEWNETLASLYHLGPPCHFTPLHHAATLGATDVARCLLDYGADVNARASQGQTPLHTATLNSRAPLVALLLRAGAEPDCRTDAGMTPLHWAVIRGDTAIVELLRDAGADEQCADHYGRMPGDWARLKQAR
ncbi:MAG TPA: sigma-70 family RNA polymerase sigma factor [Ktedonobacterales bacterium]